MELFGIMTKALKIKNDPTFEPIKDDFQIKWNKTLYSMEEKFAVILLYEKSNAAKLEIDLTKELTTKWSSKRLQRKAFSSVYKTQRLQK